MIQRVFDSDTFTSGRCVTVLDQTGIDLVTERTGDVSQIGAGDVRTEGRSLTIEHRRTVALRILPTSAE